jgi:hypothetical protein
MDNNFSPTEYQVMPVFEFSSYCRRRMRAGEFISGFVLVNRRAVFNLSL